MKKWMLSILILTLLALGGCSDRETKADDEPIKVGIRSNQLRIWNYLKEEAAKEGIDIEVVNFSSAVDPNQVLADGDIDLNAFQHVAYLDTFNESTGSELVPIGTTVIAPLGLYSFKYKSLDGIPEGAQIAVPNDMSNWGRALLLLQDAGFIKVVDDFDGFGGEDKIKENLKNIKIVPVEGASAPRVMEDTAAAVINNGTAMEADLLLKDALIHENETAKPYINIIAARKEDKDKKRLKQVVEIYQMEKTAKFIEKEYKGNYLPTFITLVELSTYKDTYTKK